MNINKKPIKDAFLLYSQMFDSNYGGFGSSPKFPTPHKLMFLSRFGVNENMINPLEMVEYTLESMFKGGLYDHIGYGFSRYSTDEAWLVPHFEKMLYNNALLLITYLDNYAYLVWALTELYNATFDVKYLKDALKFNKDMIDLFWDCKNHGFFLNGNDAKNLITNPKDIYDGSLPSGNSVASFNLVNLYKLTGNINLQNYAFKQLTAFYGIVKEMPICYSFYIIALMRMLYSSKELVVVSNNVSHIENLKNSLCNKFTPNLTIIVKTKDNEKELDNLVPFTKDYSIKNNTTTYYF